MKKAVSAACIVFAGFCGPAIAGNDDAARIATLEQDNAKMRKELDELKAQRQLLQRAAKPVATASRSEAAPKSRSAVALAIASNPSGSPLDAQAADVPMPVKANPIAEAHGRFRVWAEGGATWTQGDPSRLFFDPIDLSAAGGFSPNTQSFNLKPGLGWEAAVGFDYRFANSPWHIGGQFRYGDGRITAPFTKSQNLSVPGITISGDQSIAAVGNERRWLADVTVGRDILGTGPDALQLKGGVRISEFRAATSSAETDANVITGNANFTELFNINVMQEARFLGAGPVIGFEGSAPFAGRWSFDYAGDAAVLFGSQRYTQSASEVLTVVPAGAAAPLIAQSLNFSQQNATVFNPDVQIGVSYWVTPQVKVTGSYRLDAYLNVVTSLSPLGDVTKLQTIDRLVHGPRLGLTAQF